MNKEPNAFYGAELFLNTNHVHMIAIVRKSMFGNSLITIATVVV